MRVWFEDRYIIDERDDAMNCAEVLCDAKNNTYFAMIMANLEYDWVRCRETEAKQVTNACLNPDHSGCLGDSK